METEVETGLLVGGGNHAGRRCRRGIVGSPFLTILSPKPSVRNQSFDETFRWISMAAGRPFWLPLNLLPSAGGLARGD